MKTILIKINKKNHNETLTHASQILKRGGLVVFPTETVYGLGAVINDDKALKNIYKAKNRPSDNPLIVHICKKSDLNNLILSVSALEKRMIRAFWPGPLTIIFKKRKEVSNVISGGFDTVAVRMPKNKIAQKLIQETGVPIAAPSANSSGKPSGTIGEDIYKDLNKKVDLIIEDGYSDIGIESTVVKVEDNNILILRPGSVTIEMIKKILPRVNVVYSTNTEKLKASPGTKYKHYSPKHRLDLILSPANLIGVKMKKYADALKKMNKKIGIICSENNKNLFKEYEPNVCVLGNRKKLNIVSKNIYKTLRFFDDKEIDIIVCESFSEKGIGFAIMDRLKRASTNIIV